MGRPFPLDSEGRDCPGSDPEDADEYKAENVFWVPKEARWSHLQASAKQSTIGKVVDDAMVALERANPRIKGVLPKNYARPGLDKHRLGELIDLIGSIQLGDAANRSKDILGRVFEYFLIHHLAPDGFAGFVLANGSMSSNQSGEGDIRKALIDADLVDCMVALPGQLFYSTQIPVCLWFLTKNKKDGKRRDRRKQTLFIDARKLGTLIDRVHRELTDADIAKIVTTYHAWRGDKGADKFEDVGFSKSATTAEIATHGHVLTPGRYVGAEEIEDDGEPFEEKMTRLVAELNEQFAESPKLEKPIKYGLNG